ncbi:VanZ family protein [Radiobacillus kanasensis]|uniref:VanZ family protein n=1 Tax=Radiobacillus kanasensis TaxID=2844358 RepID=UPI001E5FA323|nr:VanZ family protein [Radiobacillus kanasensis]UFU00513.1 VanZ family protein [Radiobacillus kanasensis]
MQRLITGSLIISQVVFILVFPFLKDLTSYLHPIVLLVTWFCWTAAILFLVLWVKGVSLYIPQKLLLIAFSLYSLGLILLLFFRPSGPAGSAVNLNPFQTIQFYLSGRVPFLIAFYNLAANIGLFIPIGVFWKACFSKRAKSPFRSFLFPLILIVCIEGIQFVTNTGALDIDDLILNILGVYIGYGITPLCKRIIRTHRR